MDYERLRWQCRRGTKELDLWLTRIIDSQYRDFNPNQRAAFSLLLQSSDRDLQQWMLGTCRPENPEIAALLNTITG
ncbi:MAG: FAD assembly factor SdhE [Thiotrichales bacterium]